jgi:hypothetical protein
MPLSATLRGSAGQWDNEVSVTLVLTESLPSNHRLYVMEVALATPF